MKIMIFEDEEVSAGYLFELLRRRGHDVTVGRDGGNMAELLRERPVDVVITDIFLANTSGLQVVLDVKSHSPGTKVLAVSGGGSTVNYNYLSYALEFGADAVLKKPLDETMLASVLESFSPENRAVA